MKLTKASHTTNVTKFSINGASVLVDSGSGS